MRLEIIKSQLESLGQQTEIFELTSNELERAKDTLVSIKDLKSDNEILIPIGGDTFIYANVSDIKKILINIGAGTIVELDTTDAIDKLEKRLDNLNKTSQNIIQSIAKLQQDAANINQKVQKLSRELQGQVNNNVPIAP
jgi:prefoldin alpha subunit